MNPPLCILDVRASLAFFLPLALLISFFLFLFVWTRSQHRRWDSPYRDLLARVPGQSLSLAIEKMQEKVTLDLFSLLVFLFLWILLVLKGLYIANILSPVLSLLMAAWMVHTFVIIKKIKDFQLRRKGELLTGQYLQEMLKDGYHVYHDVVMPGFNVDHVVVGKNGVFAIETKTRRKPKNWGPDRAKVIYDEKGLSFAGRKPGEVELKQAIERAKSLQSWLSKATSGTIRVAPVLALPGWFVEPKRMVMQVPVMNPKRLRVYISEYGTPCLWDDDIQRICQLFAEKSRVETLREIGVTT